MKCISCLHGINIHYGQCANDFIAYFKVGRMCLVTFFFIYFMVDVSGALVPIQVRDETECFELCIIQSYGVLNT